MDLDAVLLSRFQFAFLIAIVRQGCMQLNKREETSWIHRW